MRETEVAGIISHANAHQRGDFSFVTSGVAATMMFDRPDVAKHMASIDLAGEVLELLPKRAVHWPAARAAIVADPHWGKEETFRAAGVAVPSGPARNDLDRLSNVLARTGADHLYVLGDLWHARAGKTAELLAELAAWRSSHREVRITLVRGNHDRRAGDPPPELRIECVNEPLRVGPFSFRHFPDPADGYVLAGHVHPAITIRGSGRQRLRLPCFWIGERMAILPAFGEFTGHGDIAPIPGDRVYAIADGEIVEVNV